LCPYFLLSTLPQAYRTDFSNFKTVIECFIMGPYRVLVVEDNHEVRRMVTASLKTLGEEIEVLEMPSAEEALFIGTSQPLDLVVLDIRLPGMSGLDVVPRLRKRKPETKIILVTGVDDIQVRQQVSEAGVDAFFFKPIDITAFLEAVKRCLDFTPEAAGPLPTLKDEAPANPQAAAVPSSMSNVNSSEEATKAEPPSTLHDRLVELKKQVKAVSVLVVNSSGQIVEEAGSATDIATGSRLLSALMHAFLASLQVSQAMAKGTNESLQYFAAPRQCIYVAPVGMNHSLFVVTSGYFGPDKLGMIYHTIHLAVHDLQIIITNEAAESKEPLHPKEDLPADVAVDKETLAKVEDIFSQAAGVEQADGFWESVGESTPPETTPTKEVLSYDEARQLGLAPDDDKPASA
jgi:CheY-like chemotaxis protein